MRLNGGAYPELDSQGIEGGLGHDEEVAEGVVLVANCMLLTVELREVSGNGTVEGGHGIVVIRGCCNVCVGDAGRGVGVNCDIMVQSGGSVDQEGSGEGGLDRRGGLLPSLEESSSAVGAVTPRVATAVWSTKRVSSVLVSSKPPTSESLSEAPSLTASLLSSHPGCHAARANGRREVCGRREGSPQRGESWVMGVDGAIVAWGRVAASA